MIGRPVRLVAMDLDGTLLGGIRPYGIRPGVLPRLARAKAAGIDFALVTGRPLHFIKALCDQHEELAQALTGVVAEERLLALVESGRIRPVSPWNEQAVAEERRLLPAVQEMIADRWRDLLALDPGVERVEPAAEADRGFVELAFTSPEMAERAGPLMVDWLPGDVRQDIRNVQNVRYVALRSARFGKGPMLLRLAQLLRVGPEEVLAIGDAENDASMLDGSFGFQAAVVGNARPAIAELVRGRGGYVAACTHGDGVLEAIETIVWRRTG